MPPKPTHDRAKKQLPAASEKKRRNDRSTSISQAAFEVLEIAREQGHKKTDFASEAILAYGAEKLGDAIPASPADVLEARLDYLERIVSRMAWESMCAYNSKRAKTLRRYVAKAGHTPFARNFEELNKQREAGGKVAVDDANWITAAFAEKFGFALPEKK